MKSLITCTLIFVFAASASADNLKETAEQMNKQAVAQLGISIKALSLLIEYSGRTVSPDYLRAAG